MEWIKSEESTQFGLSPLVSLWSPGKIVGFVKQPAWVLRLGCRTGWPGNESACFTPSFLTLPPTSSLPSPRQQKMTSPNKKNGHISLSALTEAKPVDKVKLIKEIKNYVQGINLVQGEFRVPHSPLPPPLTALRLTQAQIGF